MTILTILSVQFRGMKHIHVLGHPSPERFSSHLCFIFMVTQEVLPFLGEVGDSCWWVYTWEFRDLSFSKYQFTS